jgi:hypothetical protein
MLQRATALIPGAGTKAVARHRKCNVKQRKELRIKNGLSFNQKFQPGYDLGRSCYGT